MGAFSLWHWLIILAVVLLLFGGGGKIPKLMRDMGSGITAFRKGLKDSDKSEEEEGEESPKAIEDGGSAKASSSSKADQETGDRTAANG
ncbi:sec-independent protein translocase protein TatA [Limimonas halophila]|uniref:Sec-independent protein translocase protein TatA n=1 Tax=Limimonas halophila TaxID=1082479 RepID=A0A1G7NGP8_9PROT|nr:twin-arginine translocase TatA/TatE family subunit [Limimonas halophila]SDF73203.1 sec-independent protein translocase protein TatA [Limimonas halophila]